MPSPPCTPPIYEVSDAEDAANMEVFDPEDEETILRPSVVGVTTTDSDANREMMGERPA